MVKSTECLRNASFCIRISVAWGELLRTFHFWVRWYAIKKIFLLLLLSHSVVSNSLQPHKLQHPRLPCPSPSPWTCSKSYPLSQWRHPVFLSSVVPFSCCLQYFPASEAFLRSQLFTSCSQSTGASGSASVLPVNIQDWFPLEWTGWISLQSKGLSRVFSTQFKSINSSVLSLLHSPTLTSIHDHWKNHSLD